MTDERTVLVDASAFITLAEIDHVDVLPTLRGRLVVPKPVQNEITSDVAMRALSARTPDDIEVWDVALAPLDEAASHLGKQLPDEATSGYGHATIEGDVGILALALDRRDAGHGDGGGPIVVTDDKPLRKTCRALSIPVSGSIGVLIRAVECGHLTAGDARDALEAMDAVGARLSASLLRRAERLVDEAAEDEGED